ncbi:hypothetical protein Tco_0868918, partial [Tanacetum coccineum]
QRHFAGDRFPQRHVAGEKVWRKGWNVAGESIECCSDNRFVGMDGDEEDGVRYIIKLIEPNPYLRCYQRRQSNGISRREKVRKRKKILKRDRIKQEVSSCKMATCLLKRQKKGYYSTRTRKQQQASGVANQMAGLSMNDSGVSEAVD